MREILAAVGENPDREGLLETPGRVARMYAELFAGLHLDPGRHLKKVFVEQYDELVLVRDISFNSMCEHHMLPFIGKAHVAYIPNGWITGLSKIARVVDVYARRLQVQERLTIQIRDAIQDTLNPVGVAVVIEAQHLCMMMRGVQKQNSVTTTSAFHGEFMKNTTRSEFMKIISLAPEVL